MTKTTLTLTPEQSKLLAAAVNAEIIKGAGTFLTAREVIELGRILTVLKYSNKETV